MKYKLGDIVEYEGIKLNLKNLEMIVKDVLLSTIL